MRTPVRWRADGRVRGNSLGAIRTAGALLCWFVCAPFLLAEIPLPPVEALSNSKLEAVLLLPGSPSSFYAGPRFDHSGIVGFVKSGGHTFIGRDSPLGRVYSLGTSVEFLDPLPLKDEGASIKIGAGYLQVPPGKNKPELQQPLDWKVTRVPLGVVFQQTLPDREGWAYVYEKRITLDPQKPVLGITCRFRNTGTRKIRTEVFFHDWLLLDGRAVGPHSVVRLPYLPQITKFKGKHGAQLQDREVRFAPGSTTPANEAFFASFDWENDVKNNRISWRDEEKGIGVTVAGDWAPFKHHLYATGTEICPEPFLLLDLKPGAERIWKLEYSFDASDRMKANP